MSSRSPPRFCRRSAKSRFPSDALATAARTSALARHYGEPPSRSTPSRPRHPRSPSPMSRRPAAPHGKAIAVFPFDLFRQFPDAPTGDQFARTKMPTRSQICWIWCSWCEEMRMVRPSLSASSRMRASVREFPRGQRRWSVHQGSAHPDPSGECRRCPGAVSFPWNMCRRGDRRPRSCPCA